MEIAAILLSVISILMSGTVLVIYLAKHVFSTHVVQMVPAESLMSNPLQKTRNEFQEFDAPTAMDIAAEAAAKTKQL